MEIKVEALDSFIVFLEYQLLNRISFLRHSRVATVWRHGLSG